MVFDNLKTYIHQHAEERQERKELHQAARTQQKLDRQGEHWAIIRQAEEQRWGPPSELDGDEEHGRTVRAIVHRYQKNVGIDHLATPDHKHYIEEMQKGYFEPVPLAWASSAYGSPLTQAAFNSKYEDAAEERLYWALNNAVVRDAFGNIKHKQPVMKTDSFHQERQAHMRIRSARKIDHRFDSEGDYFRSDMRFAGGGYSEQVPPMEVSPAFGELFQPGHFTEVDVMTLIDVSSSMGWDHEARHNQPRHVDVVHNIFKRAVHHMELRDIYANQGGAGVETVCFNSYGQSIGKVNWDNFEQKFGIIRDLVYRGGGTQVMTGWQLIKDLHFKKHGGDGKAWYDQTFGWQATPRMAKLSLLVMLDGEAGDMDEFELELLGEKWAYVTICLIGKDNCPEHHRHANELTRIAHANDHINFYDIQGRISERLVVSDVLQRVYASNAPTFQQIMDPKYDLPPQRVF